MKTLFYTIVNTRYGIHLFEDEFEDDLAVRGTVVFCISGLLSFLMGMQGAEEGIFGWWGDAFNCLMWVAGTILFNLFCAYLMYILSKWLNGAASYTDVFTLWAYACVPYIILKVTLFTLRNAGDEYWTFNTPTFRNMISWLMMLLILKILIAGNKHLHGYSWGKALLNVLPLTIIAIVVNLYVIWKNYLFPAVQ